jgi:phosphoribosylcarboxyaminoimidazole (NCAIR) mutase
MDELFSKLALQTASTVTRIAINHATNAALVSFVHDIS